MFLGYGEGQNGYRCCDPVTKNLYVSRHVVFLEHIPFFSIPSASSSFSQSDLIYLDPFVEILVLIPMFVTYLLYILSTSSGT